MIKREDYPKIRSHKVFQGKAIFFDKDGKEVGTENLEPILNYYVNSQA